MVRTMKLRLLQGKVMDVCMLIELQRRIARVVGGTVKLHFARLLVFWTKTEKLG